MLKLDFKKGFVDWELYEYKLKNEYYLEMCKISEEMMKIEKSVKKKVKALKDREERIRRIFTRDFKKYMPQDLQL